MCSTHEIEQWLRLGVGSRFVFIGGAIGLHCMAEQIILKDPELEWVDGVCFYGFCAVWFTFNVVYMLKVGSTTHSPQPGVRISVCEPTKG